MIHGWRRAVQLATLPLVLLWCAVVVPVVVLWILFELHVLGKDVS